MKHLAVILVLFALLAQSSSYYCVVLNFQINRAYIAKNLCENKDKPSMHCNGKCCLKKKLNQTEKQQTSNTGNSKFPTVPTLFFQSIPEKYYFICNYKLNTYSGFNDNRTHDYSASFFHPPSLIG